MAFVVTGQTAKRSLKRHGKALKSSLPEEIGKGDSGQCVRVNHMVVMDATYAPLYTQQRRMRRSRVFCTIFSVVNYAANSFRRFRLAPHSVRILSHQNVIQRMRHILLTTKLSIQARPSPAVGRMNTNFRRRCRIRRRAGSSAGPAPAPARAPASAGSAAYHRMDEAEEAAKQLVTVTLNPGDLVAFDPAVVHRAGVLPADSVAHRATRWKLGVSTQRC